MVNYAAHRLRDLGGSLHPDATVMPEMVAPWSLLQRTTNLVEAIFWLLDGPSDAAVRIVTRSLVDLAISVAWLRLDPDVHVRLWTAEAWRRELDLLPALEWRTGTRPKKDEESVRALETKRA